MARLNDHDLTLEITFREFDDCHWVQYDVRFLWKGEPMVDDKILKRSPSGWAKRGKSVLLANEYDRDSLLPVLKHVLEANEPKQWEPTEPDMLIAFYPEKVFPFLPTIWTQLNESPGLKKERLARERARKAAGGKLPDDPITIIAMADAYQWKECDAYYGSGLALVMTPRRKEVERFYKQLAKEYKAFERRERIHERLVEREAAYDAAEAAYAAAKKAVKQSSTRAKPKSGGKKSRRGRKV